MDDRQLMQMAHDLASNFDKSLENGTLNDALQARDSFFETHQIQIDQKEKTPDQVLAMFVSRTVDQIGNMQNKHPKLADVLPIATIAGILDQYVKAGVSKERVWELVCKFYD